MAAACLLWGWQQRDYGIALDQWRGRMGPIEGRLSAEEPEFKSAAAYLRAARARERNQLPPDYEGAERLLAEGIRRDPLRPEPWLRLSRVLFFQGKVEEAEAALLRAETVDPRQPSSRLEGVQLWTLMGQRDRAVEAAQWISEVSSSLRPEAARALLVTGLSREEVFEAMRGRQLAPGDIMPLINELNPRGAAGLEALVDQAPQAAFEDAGFRRDLFERAVDRRATDLAWRLWEMERPAAEYITGTGEQRLLVENTDLRTSPMEAGTYPLGWRPPPRSFTVEPSWRATADEGADFGAVVFDIREGSNPQQGNIRWEFYRLIQPAGVPLRIDGRVRSDPARRSIVTMRADSRPGRENWTSEPSDWAVEEWQTLTLDIPAPESDRPLLLRLDRERRGSPPSGSRALVLFGGFDAVVPIPEPDLEPAGEEEQT